MMEKVFFWGKIVHTYQASKTGFHPKCATFKVPISDALDC